MPRFLVSLSENNLQRLKEKAIEENRSVSSLVGFWIIERLDNRQPLPVAVGCPSVETATAPKSAGGDLSNPIVDFSGDEDDDRPINWNAVRPTVNDSKTDRLQNEVRKLRDKYVEDSEDLQPAELVTIDKWIEYQIRECGLKGEPIDREKIEKEIRAWRFFPVDRDGKCVKIKCPNKRWSWSVLCEDCHKEAKEGKATA